MRRFRKRQSRNTLVDAVQYSVGAKPQAPSKLLNKTWFFLVWLGAARWSLLTRRGYLPIANGDFIIRYSGGGYDVLGPKTFVKLYERI